MRSCPWGFKVLKIEIGILWECSNFLDVFILVPPLRSNVSPANLSDFQSGFVTQRHTYAGTQAWKTGLYREVALLKIGMKIHYLKKIEIPCYIFTTKSFIKSSLNPWKSMSMSHWHFCKKTDLAWIVIVKA